MAYKRTKTVSGGTKTKTRSRVRKDGTTVTKTKTKGGGVKSKSRSVVGKKKTTTSTSRTRMNLPDTEFKHSRGTGLITDRYAEGTTKTTSTSQSGKAKSKTKVRGKGKVKTRTQGKKGTSQSTTTTSRVKGQRVYSPGNMDSYLDVYERDANKTYKGGVKTTSRPKTRVTKRRGKMSRDIPLPKSNF